MRVYRIAAKKFAEDISGESARLFGGRWNRVGVPLLYTSGSIALTAISYFIHLSNSIKYDENVFKLATIEIPDSSVELLELTDKPPFPWDEAYRFKVAEDWYAKAESLALKVPSEVVQGEYTILINTMHPSASQDVRLVEITDYAYDMGTFNRPFLTT